MTERDDAPPPPNPPAPDDRAGPLHEYLAPHDVTPPPPSRLPHDLRDELARAKVGLTLKGWRLAKLLGTGPVTAAYEATRGTRDDASRAVVRLLMGSIVAHERSRSLFIRGAYAANRFHHPRVLPVMADGADEAGAPFVVRAWSDGEPLKDVVAKEKMTEAAALKLAEQVLDALEMAHAHGVVHGAISPSNVLITPRGSIRLCDFTSPPGGRSVDDDDPLASRRVCEWTPPERCASQPEAASEAGDVYGLGACMYFAVSGRAPRGNAELPDDLARTPARPLREVAPNVSDGFASIVDHALSSDPAARYESAYAMLGDVRRVLAGRKPKLGDAHRPVPSGSASNVAARASTRQFPSSRNGPPSSRPPPMVRKAEHSHRVEWKANVALIFALALLVGVATFVLVREKIEDQREQEHPSAPAHS